MDSKSKDVKSVVEADEIEALFVDVIGRPLSPVSMAGMHRRDRRRDRRW